MFYKLLSTFLLRMSFAMFAAPYNEKISSSKSDPTDNIITQKKQSHNKTQKMYSDKVSSVLEEMHNQLTGDGEENNQNSLGDFNPPPQPSSSGVNKTIATEQMMNMSNNNDILFKTMGNPPQPSYDANEKLDLNNYNNYGNSKTAEEYYKRVMPGYNPNQLYKNNYGNSSSNLSSNSSHDVLLQKLNYMITLLENQQDEKTNNVTEEVVLYSFLGIFIIFIVDSFYRAGKYVR